MRAGISSETCRRSDLRQLLLFRQKDDSLLHLFPGEGPSSDSHSASHRPGLGWGPPGPPDPLSAEPCLMLSRLTDNPQDVCFYGNVTVSGGGGGVSFLSDETCSKSSVAPSTVRGLGPVVSNRHAAS